MDIQLEIQVELQKLLYCKALHRVLLTLSIVINFFHQH